MNKDTLISNISKTLKLLESEKEYAFRNLISKVSERIDFDQTLKIENVGVFQLKKEPLPRQERAGLPSASKEKRTLIYSPPFENLDGDVNSVFLTIDLDDFNATSADDIDKTLSLSVNQPLMPMTRTGDESDSDENNESFDSDLERRIINLVEDGEVLEDFDIWEEYLSRNPVEDAHESAFNEEEDSSIDEMVIKAAQRFEETSDPFMDDDNEPVDEIHKEKEDELPEPEEPDDAMPSAEAETEPVDELAKTVLDDELKAFEEIAQLEDTIDSEETESPGTESVADETPEEKDVEAERPKDEYDELTGKILSEEKVDDILGNVEVGNDEDVEDKKELSTLDSLTDINEDDIEEEEDNKSVFDELEEYLKEEDQEEPVEETETLEIPDEPEVTPETIVEESEPVETEDELIAEAESEDHVTEPFYLKKWFIITVPAFIIMIAVIFLLMTGSEPDQMVENQTESVMNNPETVDNNEDSKMPLDSQRVDTEAVQPGKPAVEENTPPPQHSGLYREISNDSQVAKQIFYDGREYTVQISSWRSAKVAEGEVNRLKEAGYDAFIYQLYLKSKNSTWNRVRIGYFKSLDEATVFIANNKF